MESIRTYHNLPTQKELARAMKVSQSYISQLLTGYRKTPKRLKQLNKLLEQLVKAA
jgi:transcriptional regulator with XRE-family HTH domain